MHKDFLDIIDYSRDELQELLDLAVRLKREYQEGGNEPVLKGKVLAMIFQKPSLRTRVSFDMAMRHLGGCSVPFPNEIGLGKARVQWRISPAFWLVMCTVLWRGFSSTSMCSSLPIGRTSPSSMD